MNPLQDLKDIHPPAAIEFWPPAYGWWLLALFVILAVSVLTLWLLKLRKQNLAKRQALQALQQLDDSNPNYLSQINQILKRVAMTYFPKQNVQELHGSQWTAFLVNTLSDKKTQDFCEPFESMQQTLYQAHSAESSEFPRYRNSVETWIKHALPPKKHILIKLEQHDA